jgi:hypothetical protein
MRQMLSDTQDEARREGHEKGRKEGHNEGLTGGIQIGEARGEARGREREAERNRREKLATARKLKQQLGLADEQIESLMGLLPEEPES